MKTDPSLHKNTAVSMEMVQNCIETLQTLITDGNMLAHLPDEQRISLLKAAGQLSRPDRREKKKINKEQHRLLRHRVIEQEKSARASTGIRVAREASVFNAPAMITDKRDVGDQIKKILHTPRTCYVCKEPFNELHFFYDSMCAKCAEFNYQKRFQTAPLNGKTAIITGSRLKIGYQATLMMLRAGAKVIATTRFPVDSALRFSREPDFPRWGNRLQIFGLDLRHTPSVELFCNYIERMENRLDILINNAAQTVRRPPGFYAHLMENELRMNEAFPDAARQLLLDYNRCKEQLQLFSRPESAEAALPVTWNGDLPGIGLRSSAQLSQIPYSFDRSLPADEVFPAGKLDADLQQIDLRTTNSWRHRLGEEEIPTTEMLEVHLVNTIAPFVLCNRLIPLMKRDFTGEKHIVNVSAMEGKFLRFKKGDRHPHTNMAKAALNMMTHTAADGLSKHGIFMNAVDTGWVTDEDPAILAQRKQQEHDFQPPLDIVDGAARVCDPFFDGILTGKHWNGKFLKDYFPIDW
jgi:NAD(P)-dependent dehydrogenase (short-subunit alcohol dehydrogenase family)